MNRWRVLLDGRVYRSPGWIGVRRRRHRSPYIVLRDVRRHKLVFSEREGHGGRVIASLGPWQLWLKP